MSAEKRRVTVAEGRIYFDPTDNTLGVLLDEAGDVWASIHLEPGSGELAIVTDNDGAQLLVSQMSGRELVVSNRGLSAQLRQVFKPNGRGN